jgi:hypothetical protein
LLTNTINVIYVFETVNSKVAIAADIMRGLYINLQKQITEYYQQHCTIETKKF